MPWSGIFVLFRWDGPIRNLRVFVTVSSPLGVGKMTDEAVGGRAYISRRARTESESDGQEWEALTAKLGT